MLEPPASSALPPLGVLLAFCAAAWFSGVLFGWSARELPTLLGRGPAPRRRKRRKRGGYYFADDERTPPRRRWRPALAWISAVLIGAALVGSVTVAFQNKTPHKTGSLRRHF